MSLYVDASYCTSLRPWYPQNVSTTALTNIPRAATSYTFSSEQSHSNAWAQREHATSFFERPDCIHVVRCMVALKKHGCSVIVVIFGMCVHCMILVVRCMFALMRTLVHAQTHCDDRQRVLLYEHGCIYSCLVIPSMGVNVQ